MSRPSKYSAKVARQICTRIANGESLSQICAEADMPGRQTVLDWLEAHPEFSVQYARAREAQADAMDDRILDVAARTERREIEPDAARVVLGALQWRAARLKPRVYGDKLTNEHTGAGGGPVEVVSKVTREIIRPNPEPSDG